MAEIPSHICTLLFTLDRFVVKRFGRPGTRCRRRRIPDARGIDEFIDTRTTYRDDRTAKQCSCTNTMAGACSIADRRVPSDSGFHHCQSRLTIHPPRPRGYLGASAVCHLRIRRDLCCDAHHRRASWRPAWTQTNVSNWRGRIFPNLSFMWVRHFSHGTDPRTYFAGSHGYGHGPAGAGIHSHPFPWSGTNARPGVIWSNVRVSEHMRSAIGRIPGIRTPLRIRMAIYFLHQYPHRYCGIRGSCLLCQGKPVLPCKKTGFHRRHSAIGDAWLSCLSVDRRMRTWLAQMDDRDGVPLRYRAPRFHWI